MEGKHVVQWAARIISNQLSLFMVFLVSVISFIYLLGWMKIKVNMMGLFLSVLAPIVRAHARKVWRLSDNII